MYIDGINLSLRLKKIMHITYECEKLVNSGSVTKESKMTSENEQ